MNYIAGKVIVITGAGNGFGRLTATKAAEMGAKVVCADINITAAEDVAASIRSAGGEAQAFAADVSRAEDMQTLAAKAVAAFGRIDVLVNNAGIMPLAFLSDHGSALDAWNRCIDINFKGVLNGTVAVYDLMLAQGAGHIVNLSSIYGNHPVVGAAVYGATKAAVNYFSHSVRQESRGKIKVSVIKPTGVPGTGLGGTVVNVAGVVGIVGQNAQEFQELLQSGLGSQSMDPNDMAYPVLDPVHIADAVIHVINQPLGVSISDITVRASGDHYIL